MSLTTSAPFHLETTPGKTAKVTTYTKATVTHCGQAALFRICKEEDLLTIAGSDREALLPGLPKEATEPELPRRGGSREFTWEFFFKEPKYMARPAHANRAHRAKLTASPTWLSPTTAPTAAPAMPASPCP